MDLSVLPQDDVMKLAAPLSKRLRDNPGNPDTLAAASTCLQQIDVYLTPEQKSYAAAAMLDYMSNIFLPDLVKIAPATGIITRKGKSVRIYPSIARVLSVLCDKYPNIVPVYDLSKAVWGPRTTDKSYETIRTMMAPLRRRIAPLNLKIINHHGGGYRLEMEPLDV